MLSSGGSSEFSETTNWTQGKEEEQEDSSSWESLDEDEEWTRDNSHKISQNPLVLEKVFIHLQLPDLLRCRLVSKLWNGIALLQRNLGSKVSIRISKDNSTRFGEISERAFPPFSRKFILSPSISLEDFGGFPKIFRNALTSLTLDCCSAASTTTTKPGSVVRKLLKSPNLEEFNVIGALPEFSEQPFRPHHLRQLRKLRVSCSEVDGAEISAPSMKNLLQSAAHTLQSLEIRGSSSLWKKAAYSRGVEFMMISELKLSNIPSSLESTDFECLRLLPIHTLTFQHCIIWRSFFQQLLQWNGETLRCLRIVGAQHEVLLPLLSLPLHESPSSSPGQTSHTHFNRLGVLTLPLEGIGSDGCDELLERIPNLREFSVIGLFHTKYTLRLGKILKMAVYTPQDAEMIGAPKSSELVAEIQSEFGKVLRLLCHTCPQKLRIDLPELDGRGLRKIYRNFPHLEDLCVLNNKRNCLDGWTGIPIKICRKLSQSRSFSVAEPKEVQRMLGLSSLKKLKRLEISIRDDPPKPEFTLLYILYGISQCTYLEELRLRNFSMSDIGFLALSKALRLKSCYINGSQELWDQFLKDPQRTRIKTFLLPPRVGLGINSPFENPKILHRIFAHVSHHDVYNARLVSKMWHSSANGFLHAACGSASTSTKMDQFQYYQESGSSKSSGSSFTSSSTSPKKASTSSTSSTTKANYTYSFTKAFSVLKNTPSIRTLVLRGMNTSMLEYYQRENRTKRGRYYSPTTCGERRKIVYWYYPDGTEELAIPAGSTNPEPTSFVLLGSWGRRDIGLLEVLDVAAAASITAIVLHGLLEEVYSLILPKLATQRDLESLSIFPFNNAPTEINRLHLQILCNSSFSLKHLVLLRLQAPPETIAEVIRSHRYTLESLHIQNHVNVSDRLSFAVPSLRVFQLDEPPGVLLWRALSLNQGVESIHFERSGYNGCSQSFKRRGIVLEGQSPSQPQQQAFAHSATNMLVDVNLFLEIWRGGGRGQKSMLQEGSDSALRFFSNFRLLTSLTLRNVHAHYGIAQGIFRHLAQLERLVFTNTTGITDEILTGLPKYLLDRIDLMNPLGFDKAHNELQELSTVSVRNLKNLRYLSLDDQTTCTDLSVIFGVLRLKQLEYFSCRKWRITDITLRAMADMTAVNHLVTEGSPCVSPFGLRYFKTKSINRTSS